MVMTLYGVRTSPYVRHARIVLQQSNMAWQLKQATAEVMHLSPTRRVPFLIDGDLTLTDSSVIVRYVREKAKQSFLPTIADQELFAMATSVLDTAVNVYLMNVGDTADLEAVTSGTSVIGFNPKTYFECQQSRILTGIQGLNNFELSCDGPYTDAEIRLACLLDWADYRNTIVLSGLDNLTHFLSGIRRWPLFAETAPSI